MIRGSSEARGGQKQQPSPNLWSKWGAARRAALGFALLLLAAPVAWADSVGPERPPLRRQEWLIPGPPKSVEMHALLYRPKGDGPFPLAVINHGSDEQARARQKQTIPDWPELVALLVSRGYAVLLPLRPGHGATGGPYLEGQGFCEAADFAGAGRGTARSIAAAVDYMRAQPFIRPTGTLVVGNSAGGWGALAYAAARPTGLAGVIDFAGGRGGRDRGLANTNCSPDRLVSAAGEYGKTSAAPTLWLYSENDTFFPPELSKRMADAFATAGDRAEYHLLGPVRGDGHALIATTGTEASWKPFVLSFLKEIGR